MSANTTIQIPIKKFKLTDTAISVIRGDKIIRKQICTILGTDARGVSRYLELNNVDGALTKTSVVSFLENATSLTGEQILEVA